jgi:hypothetical protein
MPCSLLGTPVRGRSAAPSAHSVRFAGALRLPLAFTLLPYGLPNQFHLLLVGPRQLERPDVGLGRKMQRLKLLLAVVERLSLPGQGGALPVELSRDLLQDEFNGAQ